MGIEMFEVYMYACIQKCSTATHGVKMIPPTSRLDVTPVLKLPAADTGSPS